MTVDFLLQQIAWLTERHASQVRAQMRRAAAAAKGSSAPSPSPGPDGPFTAEPMRRTGSGERQQARAPSALSIRKDSPLPRNDGSVPGTPMRSTPRPTATRTSSSNTAVYTIRNLGGSGKAPIKPSSDSQRRRLSSLPIATSVDDDNDQGPSDPPSPGPAESSDDETVSSSSSSPAQSRIIRRPPRFQGGPTDAGSSFADDDEDAEPAFLPYKPQPDDASSSRGQHDLSATLRGNLSRDRDYGKRHSKGSRIYHSQTSDSSTNSGAPKAGGPLSPRRTMELAVGRSPGGKGKAHSGGSDGTPSMGSSFSDLDGMLFSFFHSFIFFNCYKKEN